MMNRLLEAMTKAFDQVLTDRELERANGKWAQNVGDVKSELAIIDAAKKGDELAINFLFDRFKGGFAKAFHKYYVGPQKQNLNRIVQNSEDLEFASGCYELLNVSSRVSPLKTWSWDMQDRGSSPLKSLNFYMMRYAQSLAWKMIRANKNEGLKDVGSGNTTNTVKTTSFDKDYGDGAHLDVSDDRVAQSYKNIEMQDQIRDFYSRVLKGVKKTMFGLMSVNPGIDLGELGQKVGLSRPTVRNLMDEIKQDWAKFSNS
jgi:hypothetical protein